jgi:integrase/recombinase XerD
MDDHTGEKTHQDGVMYHQTGDAHQGGENAPVSETHRDGVAATTVVLVPPADPIPAFDRGYLPNDLRAEMTKAVDAWLLRTPSAHTRDAYRRDLGQFLAHSGIKPGAFEQLAQIRPEDVSQWRDALKASGQTGSTVRRKMTALRSLFSYLQTYGYTGANPAHGKFVAAPAVPRDGKTVGLSEVDCRRLLNAPSLVRPDGLPCPVGYRDQALLAVLAYSGCRVGELVRLKVRDYKTSGEHRILNITGKGGKERITPLHLEAVEKLSAWLGVLGADPAGPLFPGMKTSRGKGKDGFRTTAMTTRAAQKLIDRYVKALGLDPNVTVHSLRVTALTTARERGSDIIDLQDFAGHADPRTTLTYIRSRDRLSKSPAYVLKY